MKILIIALPRTGSSNLLFDLAKKHNLKPLFEPFDNTGRWIYDENEDNIILKTMVFQYDFLFDLSEKFDKVILLSRRDLLECAKSYAYFIKNSKRGFTSYYSYYYENISDSEYKTALDSLIKYNNDLKYISEKLNIPITYYEDIYDLNSNERLRKFNKKNINKNKII